MYFMIVLLVCFTVLLVGDILMLFKHWKNMYISKKFESRHGPYNI